MMETVLSVAMLEQEWAGHNEVSDPSAPLHAFQEDDRAQGSGIPKGMD
jgi:hypothetical protein